MRPLDILYTPLDIPEPPTIDLPRLVEWICKYQDDQIIENRRDSSKILMDNYPWNIIYGKYDYQWYKNFDKIFPELAEYCSSAYGIKDDLISEIVILHTKNEFIGRGFWHTDADEWGLRFYLDNQETGEFLHLCPSILPYNTRSDENIASDTINKVQSKIHSARLLKPTQGFFINNVRAVHSVYTSTPGAMRISVSVIVPRPIVLMHPTVQNLIINSAKKYKDYSIAWSPGTLPPT